jgi:enoyl-CoA hydratase
MPDPVELTRAAGIATLTLSRPERRNALTLASARAISSACDEIDADPSVGAVVIQGAGGYFCAGADRRTLAAVGRSPTGPEEFATMTDIYRSFRRVGSLEPPTIAAIRGGAVGAGFNLALSTDLRIVARDAILLSGFMRLGLQPGGGHGLLLSRAGGGETAAAMTLFGERIDGVRAAAVGIAWEAVADEDVETRARQLAAVPAADPELARRTARSLRLQAGARGSSWDIALEFERAGQMWSMHRQNVRRNAD